MDKIIQYFWTLAEQAPSLVVLLVGIVFALVRWKRFPKVSLMVALGLGLLLLQVIVFLFVYDLVPPLFLNAALNRGIEQYNSTTDCFLVLGLIYNLVAAVGFAILRGGVYETEAGASDLRSFSDARRFLY
jgi:riboflavin transporter FmnP